MMRLLLPQMRIYLRVYLWAYANLCKYTFCRVAMELRETLKSKSEEGDAYITEIEVCLRSVIIFPCFPPRMSLGYPQLSWMVGREADMD